MKISRIVFLQFILSFSCLSCDSHIDNKYCVLYEQIQTKLENSDKNFIYDYSHEAFALTKMSISELYPSVNELIYLKIDRSCLRSASKSNEKKITKGYSFSAPIKISDSTIIIIGDQFSITNDRKRSQAEFLFEFKLDENKIWNYSRKQLVSVY